MPLKEDLTALARQYEKFALLRDVRAGVARHHRCRHCGLDIYTFAHPKFGDRTVKLTVERWYHFVDPASLGVPPRNGYRAATGFDMIRRCRVAVEGRYDGDMRARRLANVTERDVAVP